MAKASDIEGLDCKASALEGARLVLRTRLEEMCALRDKALDFNDIDGVHDMRVASRRLRSAVRDFLPLLPEQVPQRRLKEIAAALGAVRDEDVAIAALSRLRAVAKEGVAEGLELLVNERRQRRESACALLEEVIEKKALGKFRESFILGIEGGIKVSDQGKARRAAEAELKIVSFRQAGRDIILLRIAELQNLAGSLYRPFDIEPLHRFRIMAKRLRYAIELFAPCWPGQLTAFAKGIAKTQRSLGDLHDCDVWIADLGNSIDRKLKESSKDELHADIYEFRRRAAIWLLNHFVKERTKHFQDALALWQELESTDFFARLAASLETTLATIKFGHSGDSASEVVASESEAL